MVFFGVLLKILSLNQSIQPSFCPLDLNGQITSSCGTSVCTADRTTPVVSPRCSLGPPAGTGPVWPTSTPFCTTGPHWTLSQPWNCSMQSMHWGSLHPNICSVILFTASIDRHLTLIISLLLWGTISNRKTIEIRLQLVYTIKMNYISQFNLIWIRSCPKSLILQSISHKHYFLRWLQWNLLATY